MPTKEVYVNLAVNFLSADVTSSATTLNLTNTAAFPTAGNYMVKVDDELMAVTAATTGTPGTLTVVRAQEGTAGVAHTQGTPVVTPVTDGSLRRLVRQSKNGTSVSARRETNFIEGTNVTLTLADDPTNDKCDVTIAASAGGGGPAYEAPLVPPVLTDFTWINQGGATAAVTAGNALFMAIPGINEGIDIHVLSRTTTGHFTLTARVTPGALISTNMWATVGVRDPVTDVYMLMSFQNPSGTPVINIHTFAGTGGSGFNNRVSVPLMSQDGARWVKIVYDGTNVVFSAGPDGYSWQELWTEPATTFPTPTQGVIALNPADTSGYGYRTASILVTSWAISNP